MRVKERGDQQSPTRHRGRPLRVLLVSKCLGFGGAERLLVDTVATADTRQFQYEVAYVLRDLDELVPAVSATGTPVYGLDAGGNADLRWMLRLRRLLVKGRYDVVHFHLLYPAALGQLVVSTLPHAARPGVVYTEHSVWDRAKLPLRVLFRASVRKGQQVIAVSQASYDSLPATLQRRATTFVHASDLSQADPLLARRSELRAEVRSELGVPPGHLLFMTVANLRPEKGHDVLLEAAKALADDELPVRIAVIGEGPLREVLHARHAQLGLGDRFKYLGARYDVLRMLGGADAFVLSSTQEGLGVALMEATSMALPVVASAVGGVPQILKGEVDALLVPPGDVGSLAGAMKRLALDPELRERLSRQAKDRSAQFNMGSATREITAVYERAVRAR